MKRVRFKRELLDTDNSLIKDHADTVFELLNIRDKHANLVYTLQGRRRGITVSVDMLEDVPDAQLPDYASPEDALSSLLSQIAAGLQQLQRTVNERFDKLEARVKHLEDSQ